MKENDQNPLGNVFGVHRDINLIDAKEEKRRIIGRGTRRKSGPMRMGHVREGFRDISARKHRLRLGIKNHSHALSALHLAFKKP